jgi:hypothetical protein
MGAVVLAIALWAAHFTVIYGFSALACARHMSSAVPWVVGAASAAAMLALIAIAIPAGMRAARASLFPDFLALGVGALAMIAVFWEASSLLWVPACE